MEDEKTEYKLLTPEGRVPESFIKCVTAFLNSDGGKVYIGIADDGTIIGVTDTDDVQNRISSMLRDSIRPEMLAFIHIGTEKTDGKNVVTVTVQPGTMKPYYLGGVGIKSEGVFIRKGSASIPATEATIKEMLMETAGRSFEKERSIVQELTFVDLKKELSDRGMESGTSQFQTLGLIGADGLYTNLALLLSDQCPFTIKIAVFEGDDSLVFHDRREIGGSLLHQLDAVLEFIDLNNKTHTEVGAKYREDRKDYPPEAIRELVLNCLVHRDYSFTGSSIINIYENHIEFVSIGSLVSGISMEAIMKGVSQTRNPMLAQLFYRLHLVESYGTGIRKVKKLYERFKSPVFSTEEGGFFVTIFNRNAVKIDLSAEKENKNDNEKERQLILEYAASHNGITRAEVESLIKCKKGKAFVILKKLCDEGLIIQQSEGKNTRYYLA